MRLAGVAVILFGLAACGGGDDEAAAPPRPDTQLEITFWRDGRDDKAVRSTLTCDPIGGPHPAPQEACRALAAHPNALEPVPGGAICTQIYGGSEEAEVEGTLAGRHVRASFSKRNGCEIARWEKVAPLLSLERR